MWRILRRHGFIPAVLIIAALFYWKLHPSTPKAISLGYVSDRDVILWNTLAEVRQPAGELHYGDRVELLRLEGTAAQVRTGSGTVGWISDARQIMDSDLWGKSGELLAKARGMTIQARGKTKTVSNVRVEPGRDGKRIFQFARGTPVVVLARAVADAAAPDENSQQEEKTSSTEVPKPKQEDWLLVMRAEDSPPPKLATPSERVPAQVRPTTSDAVSSGPTVAQTAAAGFGNSGGPVAGWVLARFVEFELPDAVKDYASSADLRVVAWFELNRVPDGSGGEAPQYLVAGSRGGEGQDCDFTMLRVYTWGQKRKRYETAYVEGNLCGSLPIRVTSGPKGPEFEFPATDANGAERRYVMIQTEVHRVKTADSAIARSPRR
jgi:hypothetical protein